jgi:hypothetical protein
MSDEIGARSGGAGLGVDTRQYNAHTTATDLLWGGVVYLTVAGDPQAARVAAGLAIAHGVPDLVTHSEKEYEDVAADLSYRPADAALQELKRSSHCDSDGSEPMDVSESSSLGGGDRQKRAIGRATVRMLGSAAWQAGGHWRQASTTQFGWLQKAVATGTKEGSLSPLFDGAAWVGALEEQLASAWARQPQ